MQNMKLLDLETGKYLELGEDWLYGGEYIVKKDEGVNTNIYLAIREGFDTQHFISEPPQPIKTFCEKTGAVVYGGRYVLMNEIDVWVYNNDLQPKKIKTGDVIKEQTSYLDRKYTVINVSDFFLDTTEGIKTTHKLGKKTFSKYDFFAIEKNFGNIFEEYSKQLRNELNKFEELMKLIK
jgi:hypothetical protein